MALPADSMSAAAHKQGPRHVPLAALASGYTSDLYAKRGDVCLRLAGSELSAIFSSVAAGMLYRRFEGKSRHPAGAPKTTKLTDAVEKRF
jgi:hypothetical protein